MEKKIIYDDEALHYIAKLADGHMRDAITLLDKCLAYSTELTMENVLAALNITGYDDYMGLAYHLMYREQKQVIELLDSIYASGIDFKQFIKSFMQFVLDVNKYLIIDEPDEAFKYVQIPDTRDMRLWLSGWSAKDLENFNDLLKTLVKLDADIKWSQNVKADVEATLMLF